MNKLHLGLIATILFTCRMALAAHPVITPSTNTLYANTPHQVITFSISGTDAIAGEDLNVQINDGMSGVTIDSVDILTGTIFDSNNTGDNGGYAPFGIVQTGAYAQRLAMVSTTTSGGTVLPNGLLATVTLSTVGFAGDSFTLNMLGTLNGDSVLVGQEAQTITPTYTNNTFVVVAPEPATLVTLAIGGLFCFVRRRASRLKP